MVRLAEARRIIYATAMNATDYVSKTDTIHIATSKQDGTEVVTPIWGVAVDGVPYIRCGYARARSGTNACSATDNSRSSMVGTAIERR